MLFGYFRIFSLPYWISMVSGLLYAFADVFAGIVMHINIILLFGIAKIS